LKEKLLFIVKEMNTIETKRIDIKTDQLMPNEDKIVSTLPDFQKNIGTITDPISDLSIHKFSKEGADYFFFYTKENIPLFSIQGEELLSTIITGFYDTQENNEKKHTLEIS
jgi:hypothetical protein